MQHLKGTVDVDFVFSAMLEAINKLKNEFNFRFIQCFEISFEFEVNISKLDFMKVSKKITIYSLNVGQDHSKMLMQVLIHAHVSPAISC